MYYRTGSEAVWIEPEGKLTGTVLHAAIRERVGKEIPAPFSTVLWVSHWCLPLAKLNQKPEFKGPQ